MTSLRMTAEARKLWLGSVFRSNRRIRLDALLNEHMSVYEDPVLDVGSRPRGRFKPSEELMDTWIVADIMEDQRPDIVVDVTAMGFRSGSLSTIKATELFEHVANPEQGLSECRRVLRDGGMMVLSVPFLFRIHADPFDFQRWTRTKWESTFESFGFEVVFGDITGTYFTVLGDMMKTFLRSLPKLAALPLMIVFYPVLGLGARLDDTRLVRSNKLLSSFHGGYFFIVRKLPDAVILQI